MNAHSRKHARRRRTHRRSRTAQRYRPPQLERLEPRLLLDGGGFHFVDSFDGGLGAHWDLPTLDIGGITEITSATSVDAGGQSLFLRPDPAHAGDELNEAILSVDLTGVSDAMLTFYQMEGDDTGAGDQNDPLPDHYQVTLGSSARPADALGDGLTISVNGTDWYKLRDIQFDPSDASASDLTATINRGADGLWMLHEYDLGAEIDRINGLFPAAHLAFGDDLQIKFSQYGGVDFPNGGWAIDKVQIADQPQPFDLALEPDVFHRLNLPGEDDADFYYRLGMFGTIDASTPIFVSVHGADRNIRGYTHSWENFFTRTAPTQNVIVVSPYFARGGDFHLYQELSWGDNADGRTADSVLIELVDHIKTILQDSIPGSHDHKTYLYGHSGGGQFSERFLWAHPNFVDAAAISAPGGRLFPDPDIPFPYGLGPNPRRPEPAGINLVANRDDFLANRIMFWVGDGDNAPDDWIATATLASDQGYGRLHRALNVFEADTAAALEFLPSIRDFEYTMYVSEGQGHGGKDTDDLIAIYEFLFRDADPRPPVEVYPVIVTQPTAYDRTVSLPAGADTVAPGGDFYLEIWAHSPGAIGLQSGQVEVYYDTNLADALVGGVNHGLFADAATETVDDPAGRVRELGGATTDIAAGVDEYAMLGQVHFRAGFPASDVRTQLTLALQHTTAGFEFTDGSAAKVQLRPLPRLDIVESTRVRGSVYNDANGDGLRDADEVGLANQTVDVVTRLDATFWVPADVATYCSPSAFPEDMVISSRTDGLTLSAVGTDVGSDVVAAIAPDTTRPGQKRMAWLLTDPSGMSWQTLWRQGQSELRIEFDEPAEYASIGLFGGDSDSRARVTAYDAAGAQIDQVVTRALLPGAYEIVEFLRPATDIAYLIASSDSSARGVRFDTVSGIMPARTHTDADGHYDFGDLSNLVGIDRSSFRVRVHQPAGWEGTAPPLDYQYVDINSTEVLDTVDFGLVLDTATILPDLAMTSLNVGVRNLYLAGGQATVDCTIDNTRSADTGPLNVRFYLSENAVIDPAEDVLIPLDAVSGGGDALRLADGIGGFGRVAQSIVLAAPTTDPFHTTNHYYLGAVVDADAEVDEVDETNNRNLGIGIDAAVVTYAVPTTLPFTEDWESGSFSEHWEIIPGTSAGRVEVTTDHDPYNGDYHVVLDHNQFWGAESNNQLILHADLASESQVLIGYANREWNDVDDVEDLIDYGFDTLDAPARVTRLTGDESVNAYTDRWQTAGCAGCTFAEDTLIRFQQHGERMVPHSGMAFDDIRVVSARPDLVGGVTSSDITNWLDHGNNARIQYEIRNLTSVTAARSNVKFYLSTDPQIDPAVDRVLSLYPLDPHYDDLADHSGIRLSAMDGRAHIEGDVLLEIPTSDPFDGGNHYYVGLVVDTDNEIDELDETNNAGHSVGQDVIAVQYVTPASVPFFAGWESGTFADSWEAIPGTDGRIQITTDWGPFDGTYHVTLDKTTTGTQDDANQLILHLNLAGTAGLQLGWANREWDDEDDVGLDKITLSTDQGETWRTISHLVHTNSTNGYRRHTLDLDSLGVTLVDDTWICFQEAANGPIPDDGMAFDYIEIGADIQGPRVTGQTPIGRVMVGHHDVTLTFSEAIDHTSFDAADINRFTGPGGADYSTYVSGWFWADPQTLVIKTLPLTDAGLYSMVLGPQITDRATSPNMMDQDQDGRRGAVPQDQYHFAFVVVEPLHFADMETDPGWSLDPGAAPFRWERGAPAGGGSQVPGPDTAVSGSTILGYNLAGDYANNMTAAYATTPAINAQGYEHVALSFYRWLSVEAHVHDQASIEVSTDGTHWTTIYANPDEPLFANHWSYGIFDISAIADDQPNIQVRWGMGPTNASATYAGWYLDDVMISGVRIDPTLPRLRVHDDQGAADDHSIDFGDVGTVGDSRSFTVTLENAGGSELVVQELILSDTDNFNIKWDSDGAPPDIIAAGASRSAIVTFDPMTTGAHNATWQIQTSDPDPDDANTCITLSGNGTSPIIYGWTRTFGSTGFDAAAAIDTDPLGDMIIGGFFEGPTDFDPDPAHTEMRTPVGSRDAFVGKYSPDGELLWVWTAGGSQADEVKDLQIAPDGSVLVTGEYRKTVDFDAHGAGDSTTAVGLNDVFVTKLHADGSYGWTYTCGSDGADAGEGVAIGSDGRIHVAGSFSSTVDFDPQASHDERTSHGKTDAFVVILSPGGNYVNTIQIGGAGTEAAKGVSIDGANNLAVVGYFAWTVDFDPGVGQDTRTPVGFYDVFVTRFRGNGDYAGTYVIGGPDDEEATAVAHDDAGNIYVTGGFEDTVPFGPDGKTDVFTSAGGFDVFVTRLNVDGTYAWTRVMHGKGTDFGRGITVEPAGDVLVVGSFSDTVDFNPDGGGDSYKSRGSNDAYITRFAPGGDYRDTHVFGSTQSDFAMDVAAGSAYVAGAFYGTVDFDPTAGLDRHTSHGSADMFAGRMLQFAEARTEIHGSVWDDRNGDRLRDPDEPGLALRTVFVDTDEDGQIDPNEPSTTTDSDGNYVLADLASGVHTVTLMDWNGWAPSDPPDGRRVVVLPDLEIFKDVDFGSAGPVLGDFVWQDTNGNGVQDTGESGLNGVDVRLYEVLSGGTTEPVLVATTLSDVHGQYLFDLPDVGDYFIEFATVAGMEFSRDHWGLDDLVDSDANPHTGRTPTFAVNSLASDLSWDAGYVPSGTVAMIGDLVWDDVNGDGKQDSSELGVAGIHVALYHREPTTVSLVDSVTTDATGNYSFVDLAPGDYYLQFALPGGYALTQANRGSDDAVDSDPDARSLRTDWFTVDPGVRDFNWDAGILQIDFGDAPDIGYPTTAAQNGAWHQVASGMFLGLGIDADADGKPEPHALGDDLGDGSDDEDGVVFTSALVPDSTTSVQVRASQFGRIDAWVDFNQDGDWSDDNERILNHAIVVAGDNDLTFDVPASALLGTTYARFRYSKAGVASFTGGASVGEVEDYQVIVQTLDWGDIPDQPESSTTAVLTPLDPAASGEFGKEVAISGDWLFVGAAASGDHGSGTGAVYVYRHETTGWVFHQTLADPASKGLGAFGNRIAVYGNWLAVSAPWADSAAAESGGTVHLYHWTGTDWEHFEEIHAADGEYHDEFGFDLAMYGDHLIVGMRTNRAGKAFAFHWDGASWREVQTLELPRPAAHDRFGQAVAVWNDRVLIGAAGAGDGGLVAAFEWDGTSWVFQQALTADIAGDENWFGTAVALNDDLAVVTRRTGGEFAGNVHVFNDDAGIWTEKAVLVPDVTHLTRFGLSVSVWGDYLAVGSRDYVDLYRCNSGDVSLVYSDWAPSGFVKVAQYQNRLLYGDRYRPVLGMPDAGSATVYAFAPDPSDYQTLFVNDGARHTIVPEMFLGTGIDAEANGQPNDFATGDDLDHGDDEDGVVLSDLIPGGTVTAMVKASGAGYLNAWIDFNRDGDWTDEGEQIFTGETIVPDANSLQFQVPIWAIDDEKLPTYARFRYSSVADLPFDGPAPDGEVEDYAVFIRPTASEVSGRVFDDIDADNIPGPHAVGLNHWLVELVDSATGAVVAAQRSHNEDENNDGLFDPYTETGWYRFTDVPLGHYEIRQTAPAPSQVLEQPVLDLESSTTEQLQAAVRFPDPVLLRRDGGGETWSQWFVPGVESHLGRPGMPAVPVYRQLVGIPASIDPQDVTIRVVGDPAVAYSINANLYPFQNTAIDGRDEFPEPDPSYFANPPGFEKDDKAYATNRFFPRDILNFVPLGHMRDLNVGLIEIAAGQYNPVLDQLDIFEQVSFELVFTGGKGELQTPGFVPDSAFDPYENPTRYATVMNYDAVRKNTFPDDSAARTCVGEEYLILTAPEFRAAADELQSWKAESGIVTNVVEVGGAGSKTTPTAIHDIIQQQYDQCRIRPSYVLLLGDAEFIPTFYQTTAEAQSAATDTPYVLLSKDSVDLLPDAAIGRIPVDTLDQALDVVRKIISYEKTPPDSPEFYRSATAAAMFQGFASGTLPGRDQRTYVADSEAARTTLALAGIQMDRIYALTDDQPGDGNDTPLYNHDGSLLPADLTAGFAWDGDTQDVIDAINAGRFLVTHRDHGWPDGWVHPHFTPSDGNSQIHNGSLTPVVYSVDCATGLFDNETLGSSEPDTINGVYFAEALLRQTQGGAVGVVAATRNANTWTNSIYYRGLIDATWSSHDDRFGGEAALRRLGDINSFAKVYTMAHAGIGYGMPNNLEGQYAVDAAWIYHVLGDPTLALWTTDPHAEMLPDQAALRVLSETLLVQYPLDDVTISAYQEDQGMVVALGRATVSRGVAVLPYVGKLDPTQEVILVAHQPGRISVKLNVLTDLVAAQPVIESADTSGVDGTVYFPEAVLTDVTEDQREWTQIFVPGAAGSGAPGFPNIPVYRQLVALPIGVDPDAVTVELLGQPTVARTIDKLNLIPTQHSAEDALPDSLYADPPFVLNEVAYAANTSYPEPVVRVVPTGDLRGMNLAMIEVAAGQYNPADKQLSLFDDVHWHIRFGDDTLREDRGYFDGGGNAAFEHSDATIAAVLNAVDVLDRFEREREEGVTCDGAEFLILTHPDFRDAADDLADWKNRKGIITRVIEVGAGTPWATPQQIKELIETRYASCSVRPSYVLLVGDAEFVPTWYTEYHSPYVELPQRVASGRWRTLGSYHFLGVPGEGVTLTRNARFRGEPADDGTVADAVRFTDVATGAQWIIDNGDPGFSALGSWSESPADNEFGGSALVTTSDEDTAVWRIDLPREGVYEVEAWYSAENNSGNWHSFDGRALYHIVGGNLGSDLPYGQMGGIFGDLLPDIAIGRFPVDRPDQAQVVVDKTISYEQEPPWDFGFYQNVSVVGGFQGYRSDDVLGRDGRAFIEESEHARDTLLDAGYNVDRIYVATDDDPTDLSNTPLRYYDGSLLPTDLGAGSGFAWNGSGWDVQNALWDGRFLMTYRAHGNPGGWTNPALDRPVGTPGLNPVLYSLTCLAGMFDNETSGTLLPAYGVNSTGDYFAEEWLRTPDVAVALIAANRVSPTWANNALLRGLIDATWPESDPSYGRGTSTKRLGDILNYGKQYVWANVGGVYGNVVETNPALRVMYEYHLFGDPTLEMWTEVPDHMTMTTSIAAHLLHDDDSESGEDGANAPALGPWGAELRYATDGATITAHQEIAGESVALGRVVIKHGAATMRFIRAVDQSAPIHYSASMPGGVSVRLESLQTWHAVAAPSVTISAPQQLVSTQLGQFQLATVAGTVFEDRDANGKQNGTEPGVDGWAIELVERKTGKTVATTTTTHVDLNYDHQIDDQRERGQYRFADVSPGEYTIRAAAQVGAQPTVPRPDWRYDVSVVSGGQTTTDRDFGVQFLYDYGDAPISYATLQADDGPRHRLTPTMRMGATIDAELDARPHGLAAGDDRTGPYADEDGVRFTTPLAAGGTAEVSIEVSAAGTLNAWIDFAGDGIFDMTTDQIFTDVTLVAGTHHLTFAIPALTDGADQTYARFRFSSDKGLTPTGLASDGEVEDYVVSILRDLDNDGVLDAIEAAAPHDGDGNMDGIPDAQQANVASLPNRMTGDYVTLVCPSPGVFEGVHAPNTLPPVPPQYADFGIGLFEFRVVGVDPGAAVTVSMTVHASIPLSLYYKMGPTPGGADSWYAFPFDGQTGAEFLVDRIDLHFVDGQRGDDDLSADGTIIHVGGPAINWHPQPWHNPQLPADVNGDTAVTPLDALIIINELNRSGSHALPAPPAPPFMPPPYLDANGDNFVYPVDALIVINYLNAHRGQGEGERSDRPVTIALCGPVSIVDVWNDTTTLLASRDIDRPLAILAEHNDASLNEAMLTAPAERHVPREELATRYSPHDTVFEHLATDDPIDGLVDLIARWR